MCVQKRLFFVVYREEKFEEGKKRNSLSEKINMAFLFCFKRHFLLSGLLYFFCSISSIPTVD